MSESCGPDRGLRFYDLPKSWILIDWHREDLQETLVLPFMRLSCRCSLHPILGCDAKTNLLGSFPGRSTATCDGSRTLRSVRCGMHQPQPERSLFGAALRKRFTWDAALHLDLLSLGHVNTHDHQSTWGGESQGHAGRHKP